MIFKPKERRTVTLQMRTTPELAAEIRIAADRSGLTTSDWLYQVTQHTVGVTPTGEGAAADPEKPSGARAKRKVGGKRA